MTRQQEGKAVPDPYRAVSLVLLAAAVLGMMAAFVGSIKLASSAMLAAGITLGLAISILAGVLKGQFVRMKPPKAETEPAGTGGGCSEAVPAPDAPSPEGFPLLLPAKRDITRIWRWINKPDLNVQAGIALVWVPAMVFLLIQPVMVGAPSLQMATRRWKCMQIQRREQCRIDRSCD